MTTPPTYDFAMTEKSATGIKSPAHRRSYIETLRKDPRMHAMFAGWVAQAMMEAEARYPDPYDCSERAYHAAETALRLGMSFVLDNDGELQMVREQLDKVLEHSLQLLNSTPRSIVISKDS